MSQGKRTLNLRAIFFQKRVAKSNFFIRKSWKTALFSFHEITILQMRKSQKIRLLHQSKISMKTAYFLILRPGFHDYLVTFGGVHEILLLETHGWYSLNLVKKWNLSGVRAPLGPTLRPSGTAWAPGGFNLLYFCRPWNHQSWNFLPTFSWKQTKFN